MATEDYEGLAGEIVEPIPATCPAPARPLVLGASVPLPGRRRPPDRRGNQIAIAVELAGEVVEPVPITAPAPARPPVRRGVRSAARGGAGLAAGAIKSPSR